MSSWLCALARIAAKVSPVGQLAITGQPIVVGGRLPWE